MKSSHEEGKTWSGDEAFFSSLIHEIKGPLATIEGTASLCRKSMDAGKLDAIDLRESLDRILRQSQRMFEVIESLRLLHGTQNLRFELLNLERLVHETLGEFELAFKDAHIERVVRADESLPNVKGDASLIKTLFRNLVKNALEAITEKTKGKRKLEIRISSSEETIDVAVQDNGSGMSIETVKRLFEPYRTTKAWGSGVGLVLCRRIAEAHNGRLWAETRAGRGSTFFFSLPKVGGKQHERRTSSGCGPGR